MTPLELKYAVKYHFHDACHSCTESLRRRGMKMRVLLSKIQTPLCHYQDLGRVKSRLRITPRPAGGSG